MVLEMHLAELSSEKRNGCSGSQQCFGACLKGTGIREDRQESPYFCIIQMLLQGSEREHGETLQRTAVEASVSG